MIHFPLFRHSCIARKRKYKVYRYDCDTSDFIITGINYMNTHYSSAKLKKEIYSKEKQEYFRINTALMFSHIVFAIPLYFLGASLLLKINIFSILFYALGYFFITLSPNTLFVFTHFILLEILFFIACCTLILGWDCGFHLWMFSLICTFMKDYINPGENPIRRRRYIRILTSIFFWEYISLYLATKYIDISFSISVPNIISSGFMVINSLTTFVAIVLFTRIYTNQMEIKFKALHNQADFDQLTGLGNRYYMHEILTEEENKCVGNLYYSIAMIDIDHFKFINDTYGHDNGDIVLKEVARILLENAPKDIKVSRWGGEEFLIMATHNIDYDEFTTYLEKLRGQIESHDFSLTNCDIKCTISLGAASFTQGLSVQQVIKKADNNLYIAKESGRNRLVK